MLFRNMFRIHGLEAKSRESNLDVIFVTLLSVITTQSTSFHNPSLTEAASRLQMCPSNAYR
jgi:hypothetical protein